MNVQKSLFHDKIELETKNNTVMPKTAHKVEWNRLIWTFKEQNVGIEFEVKNKMGDKDKHSKTLDQSFGLPSPTWKILRIFHRLG